MKTTENNFGLFKNTVLKLMDKYQLNDYNVYFEWKELEGSDARSSLQDDGNVTFALSTEIENFHYKAEDYIKSLAKHEVIHCLIGRYTVLAEARYISEDEIKMESEHLVRKLEKLL